MHNDEPIVELGAVATAKFQAFLGNRVGACLGESRKRFDDVSLTINLAFIRESMPFEAPVSKYNLVALESDAVGLVLALVSRARRE